MDEERSALPMPTLKHLPFHRWPEADHQAFRIACAPGDLFDETGGPGAQHAEGTHRFIEMSYRRWLGFLHEMHPDDLFMPPADRITLERVRHFIGQLSLGVRSSTVALSVANLCYAARLIAPERDWQWLVAIKARLLARARPQDRFERLVPPRDTLDFGVELMDGALTLPITSCKEREIQYRDGLLLALLSLWPIRRRSLAALTVSRHFEMDDAGVNILLHAADTKSGRPESFRVPEPLVPYMKRYLNEIRPHLLGPREHDGFWASCRHRPLCAGRIYNIVRTRVMGRFGKAMGLHDFRRAAATFLAMDAPDKIGLIPGVLQHASPDVSDRHYNLARSVRASQRYAAHLSKTKSRLRPPATRPGS